MDLSSMTPEQLAALRNLRARCRNRYGESKVAEAGIFLTCRFRGKEDARTFGHLIQQAGGEVFEIRKQAKARYVGDLTWLVAFTVGIDADLYLAGRVDLATARQLDG
jgi:hypothetical protein